MSTINTMPKQGDEVYDIRGRSADYVARTEDGHIVRPVYEHEDREVSYGKPEVWSEVFVTPPVEKLHSEVVALQAELAAARDSLREVRAIRVAEDREYAARAALRKQFAMLKKLDDFIAGKITHFVVTQKYSEKIWIQTFEDFMKPADRYERGTRLISLFGDSKGDLGWYCNQWTDPGTNGHNRECFPATSLEEAQRIAAECIEKRFAAAREAKHGGLAVELVTAAAAMGVAVPQDVCERAAEFNEQTRVSNLKRAREQLEKAEAAVRELEAK
ncbi:hypothetical protein NTJ56_08645 [Burkholderia contaminans]|uniref:hypothetical protein n=1 Tax=Burkholderia contaminans TaxID=488447 RepID=UPI002150033C|nr:hypothetical protein [Burkholderia contaminans]UUX38854.1 hypothetical protein NTJ56_08645 [Burkholderia contaminans]